MKNQAPNRISTPNLAEVLYLLDRHHQIVDVELQKSWPYEIMELAITMEGQNVDLDHSIYLRHGGCDLTMLPVALEAVKTAIWQKQAAALEAGS